MRLVRPFAITDGVITDTDLTESDFPAWSGSLTYAADAFVIAYHRIYRSLNAGNLNHDPASSDTWWQDVGPTNMWAAFDGTIQSQTVKANSLFYEFQVTGRADTLILLNCEFNQVHVEVTDAIDGVVYDKTYNMVSTSGINNMYAYLFEDIRKLKEKSITDLPSYLNPKIKVTLSNPTGVVKIGAIIVGRQRYIGRTQYGSSVGITDFSVKSEDQFGGFTVTERPYRKRGNFQVMVDNSIVDELQNLLAGYRATPIVYLGTDVFDATSIYGFYKDFSLVIQYPTESQFTLEVEGLT